jgi:hypothetical protein
MCILYKSTLFFGSWLHAFFQMIYIKIILVILRAQFFKIATLRNNYRH